MELGGWPGRAPFGYRNNRLDKTIEIDPVRANFVKKMFRLCSRGLGVREISFRLFEEGLRSVGGYRIGKSEIHRILRNPFYYGLMVRGETSRQGKHSPLISKTLFDEVQEILDSKHRSRRQKLFFPYRGFLNCAVCGCALTADKHKGHSYYHCTNGKGFCEEHRKYLRGKDVDVLTADIFDLVKFDEEIIEISYLAAKEKLEKNKDGLEDNRKNLTVSLGIIENRLSKLTDKYVDEKIPERIYQLKLKQFGRYPIYWTHILQNI